MKIKDAIKWLQDLEASGETDVAGFWVERMESEDWLEMDIDKDVWNKLCDELDEINEWNREMIHEMATEAQTYKEANND